MCYKKQEDKFDNTNLNICKDTIMIKLRLTGHQENCELILAILSVLTQWINFIYKLQPSLGQMQTINRHAERKVQDWETLYFTFKFLGTSQVQSQSIKT